jgi:DNA-binding transcriptional LysR family regulator
MNTKQLPYLLAIAKYGNLTDAAKDVRISQPALTKFLEKSEKNYGCKIFYSERHRLYPTESGIILLEMAAKIISIQTRTLLQLNSKDFGFSSSRQIRIGVSPLRGSQLIPFIYGSFLHSYPEIKISPVEGYPGELQRKLSSGALDLTVHSIVGQVDYLHSIPLFDEEVVLAVPRFNPLAKFGSHDIEKAVSISLADFQDAPFVVSNPDSFGRRFIDHWVNAMHLNLTYTYETDNYILQRELVKSGIGAAVIPYHHALIDENIVYFHLKEKMPFTHCVFYQRDHILAKEERYLIYLTFVYIFNTDKAVTVHWNKEIEAILMEFDAPHIKKWKITDTVSSSI